MEDSAKEPPPLGSYFSSPLPGMGPFCQSMKKSLTTLSVICYNARQSQYFVETIFLPTVFEHQISRLWGRLFFCAAPARTNARLYRVLPVNPNLAVKACFPCRRRPNTVTTFLSI